jgi:SAM-dependent methyltransferase
MNRTDTCALERGRALLSCAPDQALIDTSRGYLDVQGQHVHQSKNLHRRSFGQAALETRLAAKVYEPLRGPVGKATFWGLSPEKERDKIASDLRLVDRKRVLDVACGPGNFTTFLSQRRPAEGLTLGLDMSPAMLARAVVENAGTGIAYLRADAHELPFESSTFDAVACYAALYLMPGPYRALDEFMRVLAPGGRLSLMTTCLAATRIMRTCQRVITVPIGVRMFTATEVTDHLRAAGLVEIEQEIHGMAQFVCAGKPR